MKNSNRFKQAVVELSERSDFGYDDITVALVATAETIGQDKNYIKLVLDADAASLGVKAPDSTKLPIGKVITIIVPDSAYVQVPSIFRNDSADTFNGVNATFALEYGYKYEMTLISTGRWELSSQFATVPVIEVP